MSVASAIYGEMLLLREELALLARVIAGYEMYQREFTELRADIYRPSKPVILPALASRLGMMEPELVLAITRFYPKAEEAS